MSESISTKKLICGCCAAPLAIFVFASSQEDITYGVLPCKCNGVPPTEPEKAKVIMLDYYRAKRIEQLKSKKK